MRIGVRSVLFSGLAAPTLHFAGAKVVEAPNSALWDFFAPEDARRVNKIDRTPDGVLSENPSHSVRFSSDGLQLAPQRGGPETHRLRIDGAGILPAGLSKSELFTDGQKLRSTIFGSTKKALS